MTWTPPWTSQPIGAATGVCSPKTRHAVDPLPLTPTQCSVFPTAAKIGQGSFATVFDHAYDHDKVVKFTADHTDARAAYALKGKNLKGAVRVYEVAELVGVHPHKTIYGIVAERVSPVRDKIGREAIHAVDAFLSEENYNRNYEGNPIIPGRDFDLGPRIRDRAVVSCLNGGFADGACDIVPELIEAVEEVGKAGVFTPDLHSDNWGERPDGFTILDFGVSKLDPDLPRTVNRLAGMRRRRR